MTTITMAKPTIKDRILAVLANIKDRREREKIRRRVHAELSSMTDRDLADIGLNRHLISRVANEAAYGVDTL